MADLSFVLLALPPSPAPPLPLRVQHTHVGAKYKPLLRAVLGTSHQGPPTQSQSKSATETIRRSPTESVPKPTSGGWPLQRPYLTSPVSLLNLPFDVVRLPSPSCRLCLLAPSGPIYLPTPSGATGAAGTSTILLERCLCGGPREKVGARRYRCIP